VVELGAGAATLGGGRAVQLAQALRQGVAADGQIAGEQGHDRGQAAAAGQGGAEGVVGQGTAVVRPQLGEEFLHAVAPAV
jgi:hypothetical protein